MSNNVYCYNNKGFGFRLSTDEIRRLIEAPNSARYRAMIAVLYDGGLRIHEVGILRWRDVVFSDWGCRIKTSGKTGRARTVQCDQCLFVNPPGSRLCAQCGRRFTAEVEAEISEVQRAVDIILRDLDNPEVLAVLLQARLKMMGGGEISP